MRKYLRPPHKFRPKTLDSTDTVDFTHFRRTVNRYCGFSIHAIIFCWFCLRPLFSVWENRSKPNFHHPLLDGSAECLFYVMTCDHTNVKTRYIYIYHNHKPQTNPCHRKEEPHNHHETPGRQTKQSNQLSLPHQDDCNKLTYNKTQNNYRLSRRE